MERDSSTRKFYIETGRFGKLYFELPTNQLPKIGDQVPLLKLLLSNYQAYTFPSITYTSVGTSNPRSITSPSGQMPNDEEFSSQAEDISSGVVMSIVANTPTPVYTNSTNQQTINQLRQLISDDIDLFIIHTNHGYFIRIGYDSLDHKLFPVNPS